MNLKRLTRFLTGRFAITSLLIIIQIFWILLLLFRVVSYADWISTLLQIFGILVALYIINKDDVLAYRIGWILIIMVAPVLGGLLYILLGDKRPAAKMRHKLRRGEEIHERLLTPDSLIENEIRDIAPRCAGTFKYISRYGNFPAWKNTTVDYYKLGEDMYEAMLNELRQAKRFIFLEYFIIECGEMWDGILEILVEKARGGVDVRVIYDDIGCLTRIPSKYFATLESQGIKCFVFNRFVPFFSTVMNHRDHRKIMVIDGNTAFTGGINLADEYINHKVVFGHWKDTGVMLRGGAVWSFTVMFLEMWHSFRPTDESFEIFRPDMALEMGAPGYVQPFCDSPLDGETVSLNVFLDILSQAKDYVYISTPYLAISGELQIALSLAAKRGVDVRLILPGIPDKKLAFRLTRSYYRPLIKAGVKIYEYTPGFLHAKSYVCDDEMAMVGTINMDYRSLYLHFECGVMMYGIPVIEKIKEDALRIFDISHEVSLDDRRAGPVRAFFGALLDSILRVFSPLF